MPDDESPTPHKRRPRYSGKNPRRFQDKYKELAPERYADTVAKVIASGKTPAGQHLPIMVAEILAVLNLRPGQHCVDCTLGHGGHTLELLAAVQPGGRVLGLDQDPLEIARTEARLRALGHSEDAFIARRTNFAGIRQIMDAESWTTGADAILADLGVSSMQLDNPARGFSFKLDGPLDMRMNPQRGLSAQQLLERSAAERITAWLVDGADEPLASATAIAAAIAGKSLATTLELRRAVVAALPRRLATEEADHCVRRVFQALRIQVNEELSSLDAWLRVLPACLKPGGRVAVLTFHSGEDRRVKKAFQTGLHDGTYRAVATEVSRASLQERHLNPRASSAKLRWAERAG